MEKEWKDEDGLERMLEVFSALADAMEELYPSSLRSSGSRHVNPTATVDFASSAIGKSSAAQISSMMTGMQERGGNYSINLVVDGRTLANVVFDPLSGVAKQKGVALGA